MANCGVAPKVPVKLKSCDWPAVSRAVTVSTPPICTPLM